MKSEDKKILLTLTNIGVASMKFRKENIQMPNRLKFGRCFLYRASPQNHSRLVHLQILSPENHQEPTKDRFTLTKEKMKNRHINTTIIETYSFHSLTHASKKHRQQFDFLKIRWYKIDWLIFFNTKTCEKKRRNTEKTRWYSSQRTRHNILCEIGHKKPHCKSIQRVKKKKIIKKQT